MKHYGYTRIFNFLSLHLKSLRSSSTPPSNVSFSYGRHLSTRMALNIHSPPNLAEQPLGPRLWFEECAMRLRTGPWMSEPNMLYEDVEARGAGHLVVQIAGGSLCEANAGVGCAFTVIDGKGSLLLGDIESHHRTELGDIMRHVLAEEELCVLFEIGGVPFQVSIARAVWGR